MKKGLSLAFLMILIHLHLSRATSWKVNGNYKGCGAAVEDCLIGNDLEAEFSLGSHVARILYDVSPTATGRTGNRNGAAVNNCPQSQGYISCLPSKSGGPSKQNCNPYNRACQQNGS